MFCGKIFDIPLGYEKIFTNPIAAIIAVGLMALPSLYAWFNIEASWDPYGNTGNLTVAVANCDDGYSSKGSTSVWKFYRGFSGGQRQHRMALYEPDDAVKGVESGEYYAALVIPMIQPGHDERSDAGDGAS